MKTIKGIYQYIVVLLEAILYLVKKVRHIPGFTIILYVLSIIVLSVLIVVTSNEFLILLIIPVSTFMVFLEVDIREYVVAILSLSIFGILVILFLSFLYKDISSEYHEETVPKLYKNVRYENVNGNCYMVSGDTSIKIDEDVYVILKSNQCRTVKVLNVYKHNDTYKSKPILEDTKFVCVKERHVK